MKKIITCILFSVMLMLSGCTALQTGLSNAYNLANCDYKYKSVSDITISDINVSKGLSPLMIPKVLLLFSGNTTSIPMDMTINLDVNNPNAGTAAFQALSYIISIDDIQFTTGNFRQPFSVDAGETKRLPMTIGFDIAELMKKNSGPAIEKIAKNIIGIGNEASKVSVQIKPSFKVGEQTFTSPLYIPITFNIGDK